MPFLLAALLFVLQGCSRDGSSSGVMPAEQPAMSAGAPEVAATIGQRSITAAEVDALVAAQLHEFDFQKYLVRRQALEGVLLAELAASGGKVQTARIRLVPPRPAAVALPGAPAALRPIEATPVTISVFCDFESPHCAGLQPVLADVLSLYRGSVRIAARDLPLPMHDLARPAAEAARCAGTQGKYWAFHDQLWARGRSPVRDELDAVAQVVGLDVTAFRRCLDQHVEAVAVAKDLELARDLGLGIVPAVFVNGRRAPTPTTPDQLMWLIEQELESAKAGDRAPNPLPTTALSIVLRATVVGVSPGLGLAVIGGTGPEAPVSVRREGERVTPDAILRRVSADGAELLVNGRIESLAFGSQAAAAGGTAATVDDAGAKGRAAAMLPGIAPMQVYLDRELVRERMADRVALSALLKPQELTVEGYRLLKLEQVPSGSLYELLGLQAGDVIVMVNEQPIHEGDNPLWDALDRDQEVRLRVMRRGGLAQHYTYRFQ